MILFPAIDLYEGKAVRLHKGDYAQMTVYSDDPVATARTIEAAGGTWLHLVDLEGAKDGTTPNFSVVERICKETALQVEIGGGIRSHETIRRYLDAGVRRVILGTKAATDEAFLKEALRLDGERVAVGVDARDGRVAVRGWKEVLDVDMFEFLSHLCALGVRTAIVTDIAKDGAMQGTNLPLYRRLAERFPQGDETPRGDAEAPQRGMNITASGGISTYEDLAALKEMGLYGAILGKAMYTGAIDLKKALALTGGGNA